MRNPDEEKVSVIIPAYNAAQTLPVTLRSIRPPAGRRVEIVVVDDASTDGTADVAREAGCKVVRLERNQGPSMARNHGARAAEGDLFVFTDADVEFMPGTLENILRILDHEPDWAAVVGNLTAHGAFCNRVSAYKNLYTHFSFKDSGPELGIVYSGLTAVRASAFREAGGFPDVFPNEDRLFGMALRAKGYRIRFDNTIQVRHHRCYRWRDFLPMEFERARNIFLLTLQGKLRKGPPMKEHIPSGFHIGAALLATAILLALAALWAGPLYLLVAALPCFGVWWVLRPFFRFIRQHRGAAFSAACFPILLADLSACLAGACAAAGDFLRGRRLGSRS